MPADHSMGMCAMSFAGEKIHLIAYHKDAYFIREVASGKNGWVNADPSGAGGQKNYRGLNGLHR
jgi:hypothetical protein